MEDVSCRWGDAVAVVVDAVVVVVVVVVVVEGSVVDKVGVAVKAPP